jgi:UDP-N-acetylglucosamine diphosphorylase/glucosamine-1-phosphate N-acetyltransferase
MNLILFDPAGTRENLLPFTFTRPVARIRVGILTIAEKWETCLSANASYLTQPYLSKLFPLHLRTDNLLVNGSVCPTPPLAEAIKALALNEALVLEEKVIAARLEETAITGFLTHGLPENTRKIQAPQPTTLLNDLWDIFAYNGQEIRADFALITKGRTSAPINDLHTVAYSPENIFIEEGVKIRAAVLNAEDGPIYIGKDAQIQEGSLVRGPFSLGESSVLSMGSKIRGDTSIGPFCKVGGEVSNSVIFGYSNKGHEGYIGNTVIGEWCNLGADTNTSNLKNNYANVKLWNYPQLGFKDTGRQFCGLIMGDHSKSGINTMFNTGTVVGVGANIFGAGFPRNFIPSFSWGGPATGFEAYRFNKLLEVEEKVMQRRNIALSAEYIAMLEHIYSQTQLLREKNTDAAS